MIAPEDLKNKNFSRTVRGYNPIEVDDYIQFLLTKFEQLHRENAELEKRLHIVSGKYEELANDEEAIRNAVSQAQKVCESMIHSAEKSANEIISRVNARCEDIIEDAQIKVEAEEKKLAKLRIQAADFKEMLLKEYTKYLKQLRETDIPSAEDVAAEFPNRTLIEETAMDDLIPDQIITKATISQAKDPELEDFKRFVRPGRKKLSKEEKEEKKRAKAEGRYYKGQMTDIILQSRVDDEEPGDDTPDDDILAKAPEMSVKDAVLSPLDTGEVHPETDEASDKDDEKE